MRRQQAGAGGLTRFAHAERRWSGSGFDAPHTHRSTFRGQAKVLTDAVEVMGQSGNGRKKPGLELRR